MWENYICPNLAKSKMFGRIKEAYWLSKIFLSRDREENMSGCIDIQVDFKYPKNLEEFDTAFFSKKKRQNQL